MPVTLIYMFFLYVLYFCIKFLYPFFKKHYYFFGFYSLLKRIIFYFWTQKYFLFLIYLFPNFSICLAFYSSFKNFNFILFQMFPTSKPYLGGHKKLRSLIDISSGIKLILLNPILKKENIFFKGELPGSLFLRSWVRTPTFYKKVFGKALLWEYEKLQKPDFYKVIADGYSKTYLKKIIC